ncbi:hypothetical protein GCM10009624_00790 [Gordonia sinesedis]
MTNPDPAQRPALVSWAYRCWVVSGALLAALGVLFIVGGVLSSRATLLPVGVGVIIVAVGVAYVLLGTKAYTGDARWRSSLAALTLVVVVILLFLSFGVMSLAFALLAAIVGLFGSLLAYRPEAETWYTGEEPEPKVARGRRTSRTGRATPNTDTTSKRLRKSGPTPPDDSAARNGS